MAQYYTDFSAYSVGTFPQSGDDWTEEYNDGGTGEIQSDSSSEGGQILYLNINNFGDHYTLSWDGKGGSDVELASFFHTTATTLSDQRVVLRGSGTTSNKNAYLARMSGSTSDASVQIVKYTNNSFSNLGGSSNSVSLPCWVRFRANGNALQAKAWSESASEPSSWGVDITDSDHSSGFTGVHIYGTGAGWGQFGVGTEGDTAPTSTVSNPPAAPTNLQLSEQ